MNKEENTPTINPKRTPPIDKLNNKKQFLIGYNLKRNLKKSKSNVPKDAPCPLNNVFEK